MAVFYQDIFVYFEMLPCENEPKPWRKCNFVAIQVPVLQQMSEYIWICLVQMHSNAINAIIIDKYFII